MATTGTPPKSKKGRLPKRGAVEGLLAHGEECVLLSRPELFSYKTLFEFQSVEEASAFLRRTFAREERFWELRRALDESGILRRLEGLSDAEVLALVAEMLVSRRFRVARTVESEMAGGKWSERQSEGKEEPTQVEEDEPGDLVDLSIGIEIEDLPNFAGALLVDDLEKALTWIEIQLVDDQGDPVPKIDYELKLPDESIKKGTLDEKGCARIEKIPDGTCLVSFPGLDASAWRLVEG